jgi:hypothetical protein
MNKMNRIYTLIMLVLCFNLPSCSGQPSFTKNILEANKGNKIFMNNESIEFLNTIDTASINKQIRRFNSYNQSSNELLIKHKESIGDIEKGRIKGSYSNADATNLTSDYEKLITKAKENIERNNEILILLNKLTLTNGGYVIAIKRTDKMTPDGFYIPEWFIIDNNFKIVCKSSELPFFNR